MFAHIVRRLAYTVPLLLGVNIVLFAVFFFVNSPDNMARQHLGVKREASEEQIETWKREHGYDLPRFMNLRERGVGMFTETIFFRKSLRLFMFDFGKSDTDNGSITSELFTRIPYSMCITVPAFVIGLLLNIYFAMIAAFYRASYIDTWLLVICVVAMSIPLLLYIFALQYIVSYVLRLVPVSGFDLSFPASIKFALLPVIVGVVAGFGRGVRYNRTLFLEEINKDYIRTARAKGLNEKTVLFKHALKNAMAPILTNLIVAISGLFVGSLLMENFFGIPGAGSYMIDAISKNDFAVIRALVFLGSLTFILSLILVDISYTIVDPRVRLR
jgi:peptide/nickel transport system permease protein